MAVSSAHRGAWLRALRVLHEMHMATLQADATALNAVLADCATGPWPWGLILLQRLQQFGSESLCGGVEYCNGWSCKKMDVGMSPYLCCNRCNPTKQLMVCCWPPAMRVCRAGHLWQLGLSLLPRARAGACGCCSVQCCHQYVRRCWSMATCIETLGTGP